MLWLHGHRMRESMGFALVGFSVAWWDAWKINKIRPEKTTILAPTDTDLVWWAVHVCNCDVQQVGFLYYLWCKRMTHFSNIACRYRNVLEVLNLTLSLYLCCISMIDREGPLAACDMEVMATPEGRKARHGQLISKAHCITESTLPILQCEQAILHDHMSNISLSPFWKIPSRNPGLRVRRNVGPRDFATGSRRLTRRTRTSKLFKPTSTMDRWTKSRACELPFTSVWSSAKLSMLSLHAWSMITLGYKSCRKHPDQVCKLRRLRQWDPRPTHATSGGISCAGCKVAWYAKLYPVCLAVEADKVEDDTNTVSSLPLSSLLFVFSSSACPQTDTAQLYNTQSDLYVRTPHMDRTGLFVCNRVSRKTSVVMTSYTVAETSLEHLHFRQQAHFPSFLWIKKRYRI